MSRFAFALVLGSTLLAGCDDDGIRRQSTRTIPTVGTTTTGTNTRDLLGVCDRIELDGTCTSYLGSGWTENDVVAGCNNGVYTPNGSCPRDDSHLGTCANVSGTPLESWTLYYEGDWWTEDDRTDLQSNCELNGGNWF